MPRNTDAISEAMTSGICRSVEDLSEVDNINLLSMYPVPWSSGGQRGLVDTGPDRSQPIVFRFEMLQNSVAGILRRPEGRRS